MATIATPVFEEYAGGTVARAQVGLWRDGFRSPLARGNAEGRDQALLDRRGVVSKQTNILNAADPKFDAQFKPGSPEYATAGARSTIHSTNLPKE